MNTPCGSCKWWDMDNAFSTILYPDEKCCSECKNEESDFHITYSAGMQNCQFFEEIKP